MIVDEITSTVTNSCGTDVTSTSITVNTANASAESDTTIELGTSAPLTASGGDIYSWSPSAGLSCDDCPDPIASPTQTTIYYVTVTNSFGCTAVDNVTVEVISSTIIYIPNIFSPSGDGANDEFRVLGGPFQGFNMSIYDRWGLLLFQTSEATQGWDGTYNGKPVNSGVYVYIVRGLFLNEEEVLEKGNVTLVR